MYKIISFFFLVISCGSATKLSTSDNYSDGDEMINVGYGKVAKKDLTISVSSMKVPQTTTYTNIYELIQGRLPGVQVSGNKIRIRGTNTILGNDDPLILVDGIEMDDISVISPDMVDSIDILKDAAASSIYGVRAANGVILITMRKAD